MAKAKAKSELLERVVIGPKPLHHVHPETGARYLAAVGETISISPHQAKSKARYLQAPTVAKAMAAAKKAEEVEAEAEAGPAPNIAIDADTGGDSAES